MKRKEKIRVDGPKISPIPIWARGVITYSLHFLARFLEDVEHEENQRGVDT